MEKRQQKRQRNVILSGILGVLVLLAAVFVITRGEEPSPGAEVADLPIAPETGSTAPDFELANKDGDLVSLSDYRGQPVAVTFMHTWWPVCNASAPEFRAAYEKYQDDGLVVLSVSVQENKSAVEGFIDRYGLEYPFLMDTNGDVSQDYNVYVTPTTYFVNPDGVISAVLPGTMSQQWIDQNMTAIQG